MEIQSSDRSEHSTGAPAMSSNRTSVRWCPWLVAVLTFAVILAALDGTAETNARFDAPGLTLDEVFNIQTGVYLWRSLLQEGPAYFSLDGAQRVFTQPQANPDHPPLGRLIIGVCHDVARPLLGLSNPALPLSVLSARTASAVLFACTIGLVGSYAGRWYGPFAGAVAALALALMPRVAAHGRLAALETAVGLLFSWTVLYFASASEVSRESGTGQPSDPASPGSLTRLPRWRTFILAGLLFGLTLLTKIQAVLLPLPIAVWCVCRWRLAVVPRLMVFGAVGLVVFFAGWPWLWLDPLDHLREYFAGKVQRPTLYCYYLGRRFADVDVPWHYPYVMFLATVPIGLHLLGTWGARRSLRRATRPLVSATPTTAGDSRHDPGSRLLLGTVLFVLTFFAVPGITVYDGERLFLVVFPLWAVLIGKGAAEILRPSGDDKHPTLARRRRVFGTAILLTLGIGEGVCATYRLHPCQLSYYNWAVGGLAGANRLGFEPTYWRDSVTRRFLADVAAAVPPESTLYVAPVLHPANRIDLLLLSPLLQQHRLMLDAYDDRDPAKRGMRYVLVFRRHADPWAALEPAPAGARLLCEVRRAGVQLAALYELNVAL